MKKILLALASTLTILLSGCQSDEPGAEASVQASFSIAAVSQGNQSRAQQLYSDNELINDWWIAFVSAGGRVESVVSGTTATPANSDNFKVELPPSTYTVYAFANCDALPQDIKDAIDAVQEGQSLPEGFENTKSSFEAIYTNPAQLIPMSGVERGIIVNSQPKSIVIHVFRMLAKIEFEFVGGSEDSDITVGGATFGDLYAGGIDRFASTGNIPDPVITSEAVTPEIGFTEAVIIPKGSTESQYRHFYVRETSAEKHPTGRFHFSLKIRRGDKEEEQLYALTSKVENSDEILGSIRRNDYIQIPVTLVEWSLELEAECYAPIGGYPPTVTEKNEEYYVRFGIPGEFSLRPLVRRGIDGPYPQPDQYSVSITSISGDNIIEGNALRQEAGELLGELTDAKGTAVISCTISVADGGISRTFNRNFYIIRD